MHVKLDGTGLRFRITAAELEQLQGGKTLQESLQIGCRRFAIAVDPVAVSDDLAITYDEDMICLLISPARVEELAAMGRSREGLEQMAGSVTLSLQVDFRTQKRA